MTIAEVIHALNEIEDHCIKADAKIKRDYGPGANYYLCIVTRGPNSHIRVGKEFLAELKSLLPHIESSPAS